MSPRTRSAATNRHRARYTAVTRQVAADLLGYPDDALLERLALLGEATATLPARFADGLQQGLTHLGATAPGGLRANYVETFDLRRRCCLYLTYYRYGDTRKRGMALLRFTHAYRSAGAEFTGAELPDFLPAVLEFAATVAPELGERLLVEHRAGLDLLHLALVDAASPYAGVVDAVARTLPAASAADRDTLARLVADGPPAEEVGLEPFGPPEYMGGPPPEAGPQDLAGSEHVRGAGR